MLTSLSIKNYALIDNLDVNFNNGLTIITGETGAGKSILLGGLSLILGKRADLNSIKDTSKKCIIEAVFDITNYNLKSVFRAEDLDYEEQTIIRREILPSGKSRAFINDSPVNLDSLKLLSDQLIDIHSQHQTLELVSDDFQFQVIDALAKNEKLLEDYTIKLNGYKMLEKELQELIEFQAESIKEHDYNSFLLNELKEAKLESLNLQELEEEYETLDNIEDITEKLSYSNQLLSNEEMGVLKTLLEIKNTFQKLSGFSTKYETLFNRIDSSLIELNDIENEAELLLENLETNPRRLEEVNLQLQTLHNLMQKHVANDVDDLIEIRNTLEDKVFATENMEETIKQKQILIAETKNDLKSISKQKHKNRVDAIPVLSNQLEDILKSLGIPNAKFKISLNHTDTFYKNGSDELRFLFSANKGGNFNELKKAASGGELSRIMLGIKLILSNYIQLPTIMFD
ncbi:MAG: AAA family ATPase, partial [Flavobacteriaceae bacterium]